MKRCMMPLVLALSVFLGSCKSEAGEKINFADYLPPDTKVSSPDGSMVTWCVGEGKNEDDFENVIYAQRKGSLPIRLCSNIRTFGVMWCPDSRFLAVGDNFAAGERQILVFDMEQKEFPLIYAAPMSKHSSNGWNVKSWQSDRRLVTLIDVVAKKEIQVKLLTKRIKRTEY